MKIKDLWRQRSRYDRRTLARMAGTKSVRFATSTLSYLYLIGISFVILYPILYMLSMAFRPSEQVNDLNVVWIPTRLTLDNIIGVWTNFDFATLLKNSVVLSLGGVTNVSVPGGDKVVLGCYRLAKKLFKFN